MPAYKIASGDLRNTPLLRHVASIGKPMIVSTGGATMEDIDRAVEAVTAVNPQICLLQCTAVYPAAAEELELGVITTLRERYPELVVGLSDHQDGIAMSLVAYMLGARVMEKHFTLSHTLKGTDHAFSLMPEGMRKLVRDLRRVPAALGRRREAAAPVGGAGAQEDGEDARGRARSRARPRARPRAISSRARRPTAAWRRTSSTGCSAARSAVRCARTSRSRPTLSCRSTSRWCVQQAELAPSRETLASMRLAVFDFDGVFTDNYVWVDGDGCETVRCCRADGLGLRRLREVGVDALVVSMETAPVVGARARKLGVGCIQGIEEKLPVLREQACARGIDLDADRVRRQRHQRRECLGPSGSPSARPTRGRRRGSTRAGC